MIELNRMKETKKSCPPILAEVGDGGLAGNARKFFGARDEFPCLRSPPV